VVVGVDFPACTVPLSKEAVAFQQAIEIMFKESSVVENAPLHITFGTKRYQALKTAWELMYHYPEKTLQPVLDYYKEHGELPVETEGTVLPHLIEQYEQEELSMDEVLGIGVQAIAAAVDTTSQTTEYLLYNLARNQDVQDELLSTIPMNDGPFDISREDYESQKYLFATLKESMRLTPTIGAHARTLVKDADLGDYLVKEGTMVLINYLAMTKDPSIFPEPHLFLPERFLKEANPATAAAASHGCPFKAQAIEDGKAVMNDPYAAIPFGHGGRKCVGAGFAAMDVHLAVMALLRKFKVEYDGPDLVQREDSLLRPVEPISPHFRFVARG
jgi:cytochrome P450